MTCQPWREANVGSGHLQSPGFLRIRESKQYLRKKKCFHQDAFPRGRTAFVTTPVSHDVASRRGDSSGGAINILSHSEQCCPNVLDGVRSSDSHVGSREVDEILNS